MTSSIIAICTLSHFLRTVLKKCFVKNIVVRMVKHTDTALGAQAYYCSLPRRECRKADRKPKRQKENVICCLEYDMKVKRPLETTHVLSLIEREGLLSSCS